MCFYLYAQSDNSSDLLDYLHKEEHKINNGQSVSLDFTYALNICKQKQKEIEKQLKVTVRSEFEKKNFNERIVNLKKAQIILYGILKAYGKSVELALEVKDRDLARDYANKKMNKRV